MTDLRKAAEMALEALETWKAMNPNTTACAIRNPATQALRQALAQPKWVGLAEDEFEVKILRHDLAAAETEIRETRRKIIENILELFKIENVAKADLERSIREML